MRSPALSWVQSSTRSSHSGRGVLGVEAGVEVEARPVLQEHVGVAGARDHLLEEVAGDVVGREPPLAVQRAGEPVLVLHPEDSPLHGAVRVAGAGEGRKNWGGAPQRGIGQHLVHGLERDPPELAARLGAVEHGHLEVALGQRLVLGDHEGPYPELEGGGEVEPLLEVVLEVAADLVGLATHGRAVALVLDGPVVKDMVDLVLRPVLLGHLAHEQLHLEGLDVLGEDVAEPLRVRVGQGLGAHVPPAVGVPLDVGQPHPRHPQVLELVVLAHPGEGDTVVDLRDLVEQGGRVLGHEQDAVAVLDGHDGPPAGDALAGILRLVLHHLLGGNVVRQRHQAFPRSLRTASQ